MWVAGGLKYQENRGEIQEGLGSDFPAPVTPAAHYSFGNGVMKYLIYHDRDWNYATDKYDTFREDAKLAGKCPELFDAGLSSLGVYSPRRTWRPSSVRCS